jgi:hypothetical protein
LGAWYLPFDDFGKKSRSVSMQRVGVDSLAMSWEEGLQLWGRGSSASSAIEGAGVFVDESCAASAADHRAHPNNGAGAGETTADLSAICFSPVQLLPFVRTPCFHASNIFDTSQLIHTHHMPAGE